MNEHKIRLGLMGFGNIGRQLYSLAAASENIEIVAISDIGKPEVLHYLLNSTAQDGLTVELDGNYLVNQKFRTRMMLAHRPAEVPWDLFGVDCVVDTTGKFKSRTNMQDHLNNGAKRVVISTLPSDFIERMIIPGINEQDARVEDQMISAGSATTTAFALILKVLSDQLPIDCASMTSVHAYTSDQPLQDYAGVDFRRSRSAAENIIPNTSDSARWVEQLLPQFAGKLSAHALNVPVQKGSLLDLNLVFNNNDVSAEDVNKIVIEAKAKYPRLIEVIDDPIVSSDVIGSHHSVLFDLQGTLKGGKRMVKTLAWYESLGHANRILDVIALYHNLDSRYHLDNKGATKCA